jgi:hypothetical protein
VSAKGHECELHLKDTQPSVFHSSIYHIVLLVQVSRAAYMALYVWQEQAPLSSMCDEDVQSCKSDNPRVTDYPGKILDCLVVKAGRSANASTDASLKSKLSEDCRTILSIAQPPDVKDSFDTYFQVPACPSHTCALSLTGICS